MSFPFLRHTFPSSLSQLENMHHLQYSLAKLPLPRAQWSGYVQWSILVLTWVLSATCDTVNHGLHFDTFFTWLPGSHALVSSSLSLVCSHSVSLAAFSTLHLLDVATPLHSVLIPLLYLLSLLGDLIQFPGFKYHPYAADPQKYISKAVKPLSQTQDLNIQLLTWYLHLAVSSH